ncbi:glycosyltransferase family 39 protein [Calothrix sp. NIES-3974]|uniref:glycosyltransferase family 39 protein n=1 Tax=Calothrix sp. NIES-3974 TaxID=2005462 RepID=UPI001E48D363|nr:glycosyltransferase [Calothrix sp. NIES-3974]
MKINRGLLLILFWTLIALILRLSWLDSKPPWTDEFSTLVFSLGNSFLRVPLDIPIDIDTLLKPLQPRPDAQLGDVLKNLFTESNHPPLYFLLTHLWVKLFPLESGLVSVFGARSLAAILGGLSVPAIYGLGRLAFNTSLVAEMGAAMMATSAYAIFLGQEARHYTLAILWVIASLACTLVAAKSQISQTKIPWSIAVSWIIVNGLGIASHYFFVLILLPEVLILVLLAWRNHYLNPSYWRRILAVGMGTAISGLVWIPVFLQNSYGGKLTEWIQGERTGIAWISPIFQALAAWITMIVLLPIESPALTIVILAGIAMFIYIIWAVPILYRGWQENLTSSQTHLSTWILSGIVGIAIAQFFIFTYVFGIDLTRGARYNFVYFPAVIVLVGASLAVCWSKPQVNIYNWKITGKMAVVLILLVANLSAITVIGNLGYQKYYRPDLFADIINQTSQVPVLITTTQKTHVHIGEMMGIAREFKLKYPNSPQTQFLLTHQDTNPQTSTIALQTALEQLSRPLDVWVVNFFADLPDNLQTCQLYQSRLPDVDGYEYKLYRCR